ncbi:hypothetical protein N7456_004822, partial [Penicillium angulare]
NTLSDDAFAIGRGSRQARQSMLLKITNWTTKYPQVHILPRSHATSQTNQGPFPPRPVPIPPPQGQISQARPSALNLATWTSYSGLDTSVGNLISHATQKAHATVLDLETLIFQCVGGAPNVHEPTSRLLDQVITSIDSGVFCGRENELVAACALPLRSKYKDRPSGQDGKQKPGRSSDYFSKVYLYANSRMPMGLTPIRFYPATYPLLQLAAQYSRRVYDKPNNRERSSYVHSDWLNGTKAMVIKSLPVDNMNTILFAIRGTQSFMDWTVNMNMAPVSPSGFLDDPSNFCHAGFLSVARKMVALVAARLRALLEEDPNRMSYSLLITGHSAGGAVASLLYLHLLSGSTNVQSELTHLRGCFKHIHCVTFGAPPISFRPLLHPASASSRSMFFSFVNEGDPVCRAEKGYFLSLLDLYAKPPPGSVLAFNLKGNSRLDTFWPVPAATLSTAGRMVLLRDETPESSNRPAVYPVDKSNGAPPLPPRQNVEAYGITDLDLRNVVFGDPLMHMMDLYARRLDILARDSARRKPRR